LAAESRGAAFFYFACFNAKLCKFIAGAAGISTLIANYADD